MSKKEFKNFYGIVYCTINLINGKIYIGKYRYDDIEYLGSGLLLRRAIQKYGKVNFKRSILCVCYNKEELNLAEKYLIKEYNSRNNLIGYNITKGMILNTH